MANEPAPACRATWLVDPGRGNFLTRADLVRAHQLYEDQGFSLPWLWYAPESVVSFPGPFPQEWTSCPDGDAHINGICAPTTGLPHNTLVANFATTPVTMTVFQYNGNFVSAVCGNFGVPLRPLTPPVPVIGVHKFNDVNGNGVQDAGEPPLAGWVFQLIRQSSLFGDQDPGLADTQSTDADGNLTFSLGANAGPGTYIVQEVRQDDWAPTTAPAQTVIVPDGVGGATVADLTFGNTFQAITATGSGITPTEGAPFTGTVATFTDPDPAASAGEYAATVDWGDNTPTSAGVISKTSDGTFVVTGTHTYTEETTASVGVVIRDVDNPANTATVTTAATIGDAALTATGNPDLLSTNPVTDLPVATFTDANPGGPVTDFTASIDWGDGTPASNGTITGPTGGPFTVTGTHTYATLGPKTITVHIIDDGGATATACSHLILFAYATGGNFVIGGTTAGGADVNFWGAQWAKNNPLAATPPAAFKGFEDNATIPACGGTWASRPGNSSNPPDTIPTYLAVIVSTHVDQDGSTITGDVQHIVIVATNPGYAGDPGHDGTGTIVATLC